ncbi:MAG TPA: C-terminal binding protein, partial [Trueperaceae bacterium]|nr:C-terminal binding protein [Trueperaceae bacterium]
LSLMRALPILDKGVRNNRWDGIAMAKPLVPLKDAQIGLIGLGRIGSEVVKRLKVFGSTINVYDPFLSQTKAAEIGVNLVGLEEIFSNSDAISLHSPLNEQTKHIINADSLVKMKPNAVIVNAARGGLIDTEALINALKSNTIRAAALDVFEQEPLADDSELKDLANVFLSPHLAWYSDSAIERLQRLAGEEAARAVAGEPLRCPYPL